MKSVSMVFTKVTSQTDLFLQLLQCDGNLYDAISIAIKAALFNTK